MTSMQTCIFRWGRERSIGRNVNAEKGWIIIGVGDMLTAHKEEQYVECMSQFSAICNNGETPKEQNVDSSKM